MSQLVKGVTLNIEKPPTAIVNAHSSGGASCNLPSTTGKQVLSGALTAATLKQMVSVSGAGTFQFASAISQDGTARTVRLQVILDGVTVFDATSDNFSSSAHGVTTSLNAATSGSLASYVPEQFRFKSSLVIKIASSNTETDKIALAYSYYTV